MKGANLRAVAKTPHIGKKLETALLYRHYFILL